MAYNFKTSSIAIPFLAQYADSMPILLNCNKQLDKEWKPGVGSTMTISLPDHPNVGTGPALDEGNMSYAMGSKTLTLVNNNVAFGADFVQRALDISDLKGQVTKPWGNKLASYVQKNAAKTVQLKAAHQIVLSGTKNFEEVGGVIAAIRASRSFDDLFGCLGPQLNSKIISSGIQFFNPGSQISDMFKNSKLGTYNTTEFYTSPDVVGLTTGTLDLGATANVKTTLTAGGTTLIIRDGALAGTVKAGQGFQVAGIMAVDIYGESVGTPYTFVALADAVDVGANEIAITIKPVYTAADNKPLANISAYPTTADLVTQLQEASSAYLGGIIWDKQSLMFGSGKFAPISGCEEDIFADGPNGIAITVFRGPDVKAGREILRMDVLTGFELIRDNWAGVIWLKVA